MKRFFCVLCGLCGFVSPALAEDAPSERATALVKTLVGKEDEDARRHLVDLKSAALRPLAEALSQSDLDSAAYARLESVFTSLLRMRLEELDVKLSRMERERAEAAIRGKERDDPSSTPPAVAEAIAALESDLTGVGAAAAAELAREGAARDELSLLARDELLKDIVEETAKALDAAAAAAAATVPPAPDPAEVVRLARLGPLAAPALRAIADGPDRPARPLARAAVDRAVAEAVAALASEASSRATRELAERRLFGLGELARPALEKVAADPAASADATYRARRLIRRIRWSCSDDLHVRTGHLLEGFEERSWRERRLLVFELEKLGGPEAVPTLRRILERDPSAAVRSMAAEGLARLGDPVGGAYLQREGREAIFESPEVTAAIAMDQGIKYLTIKRYDKAIAQFQRVVAIQPRNEVAFYNLACAYSLQRDVARGLDHLEKAVELGFTDWEHMERDKDLDNLRASPRYRTLIDGLKARRPAGAERPKAPAPPPDAPKGEDEKRR